MSNQPKSASEYGTHRPRKIAEFLDENLILLSAELVTKSKDDKPLPYGPFYVINFCVDSTGERIELVASNKYIMMFLDAVKEAGEFPVNFRLSQVGKAFAVGDWQ